MENENNSTVAGAAIRMRHPDAFLALVEGFKESNAPTIEAKLDEALRHVVRATNE